MDTYVRSTPGESWPSTHRWSQCLHDARNPYAQYVPIGNRLLGRYLDKAYNSAPGGVGSNPPHGISVYARVNTYRHLSARRHNATLEEYRATACHAA
jgi:hypothetical protein